MTPTDRIAAARDWYTARRSVLPTAPFRLCQGCTVRDPPRFYASLDEAIAAWDGSGNRVWVCLILLRIRKLKTYLEGQSHA